MRTRLKRLHFVVFDDNDKKWIDVSADEEVGELRWLGSSNKRKILTESPEEKKQKQKPVTKAETACQAISFQFHTVQADSGQADSAKASIGQAVSNHADVESAGAGAESASRTNRADHHDIDNQPV